MKQELKDYKDYTERIYQELKEKDPDKYKHITKKSIKNHLKHIDYSIISILTATATEFVSPFFELKRGYRRYVKKNIMYLMQRKYYYDRQKELNDNVHFDNVVKRLNIIICLFRSNWRGIIYEKNTKRYTWNGLRPFDVKKRMNRKFQ